jgi:hypothetical protein
LPSISGFVSGNTRREMSLSTSTNG